jgi:hypothetical protein
MHSVHDRVDRVCARERELVCLSGLVHKRDSWWWWREWWWSEFVLDRRWR